MLHLPSRSVRWTFLAISAVILPCLGCRQAGTPNGFNGAAPLTPLPGQAATTGPLLPSLGPFGASARVPPPSTGSYGATAANMSFGASTSAAGSYAPAGYAPGAVQPMSFEQPIGSGLTSPVGNPLESGGSGNRSDSSRIPTGDTGSGSSFDRIRSGGMQVIDLTGAAAPSGNQADWASTPSSLAAVPSPPGASAPAIPAPSYPTSAPAVSSGGFVDTAPAANQPAFSTADRPLQWQTPRR